MKINGTIAAQNTIFANNSNASNEAKRKNPFDSRTYDLKKYDTFTMVGANIENRIDPKDGNMSLTERFKTNNAELIRNLEGLSKEEKAEVAVESYLGMQKTVKYAVQSHEEAIDYFGQLQDAKAYYGDLLSNGGKITDENGKYGLLHLHRGDTADKEELQNAYYEIQDRIDSLIGRYDGKNGGGTFKDLEAKVFASYSVAFSMTTGIYDDSLAVGSDLTDHIEGINEENFIAKHGEAINKLEQRSEKLKDVMTDYMKYNDDVKEIMKDPGKLLEKSRNKFIEQQREALRQIKELEQLKELRYSGKSAEKKKNEEDEDKVKEKERLELY